MKDLSAASKSRIQEICQSITSGPRGQVWRIRQQVLHEAVLEEAEHYSDADVQIRWFQFCQDECGSLLSVGAIADMAKGCLDLFNEDEERNFVALDVASNLLASRKVKHPQNVADVYFLRSAGLVWNDRGHQKADQRYCQKAIEVTRRLLKSKQGQRLMALDLRANLAGMLFKRQEIGGLSDETVAADLREALALSKHVYDKGSMVRNGETRATDCEIYALANWALSKSEDGERRTSQLRTALAAAEESVKVGDEGPAWAKHESVRCDVLFDLLNHDGSEWEAAFVASGRALLESGFPCASASWNLGNWYLKTTSSKETAFKTMLKGAAQFPGPTIRIETYNEIFSQLIDNAVSSHDGEWQGDFLNEVLSLMEGDVRSLLAPHRTEQYSRSTASALAWLGPLLADLRLRASGDWEGALSALGCMSSAIWEMEAVAVQARQTSPDLDVQLEAETRAYAAITIPRVPGDFNSRPDAAQPGCEPTLIVVAPGLASGWAIVRSVEHPCVVIELPGCSMSEVEKVAARYHGGSTQPSQTRGNRYTPDSDIEDWLDKTVLKPLIDSKVVLTSWIVWCPIGALVQFPLTVDGLNPSARQSFVSDPLFTPVVLSQHQPSDSPPDMVLLGWTDYAGKATYLSGVKAEAAEFVSENVGSAYLDTPIESLLEAIRESDLHIACHGKGTTEVGDAMLRLGPQVIAMHSIRTIFKGDRDLVLLNACLTSNPAEGLWDQHLTVVKSFGEAGAKSIVGNLWPVSDGGGLPAVLVKIFYRSLCASGLTCRCHYCVAIALKDFGQHLKGMHVPWKFRAGWQHHIQ